MVVPQTAKDRHVAVLNVAASASVPGLEEGPSARFPGRGGVKTTHEWRKNLSNGRRKSGVICREEITLDTTERLCPFDNKKTMT